MKNIEYQFPNDYLRKFNLEEAQSYIGRIFKPSETIKSFCNLRISQHPAIIHNIRFALRNMDMIHIDKLFQESDVLLVSKAGTEYNHNQSDAYIILYSVTKNQFYEFNYSILFNYFFKEVK